MNRPSAPLPNNTGHMPEDAARSGVVLSTLQDLVAWGRKNSIWPFNFGLSCCYVEMATSITSRYDISRFGSEVIRSTPREADVMVIAGTVFIKAVPVIRRLYEQMMEPRWVISMGSCANSGGMYDIYSVVQGVDSFLPVDVYIPGCPPRPEAFIEGLMLLQKAVGKERRPLSWITGRNMESPGDGRHAVHKGRKTDITELSPPDSTDSGLFIGNLRENPKVNVNKKIEDTIVLASADRVEQARETSGIVEELNGKFGMDSFTVQPTKDDIPTLWIMPEQLHEVLTFLKYGVNRPYRMLYDLTAMDERARSNRPGLPESDFTLVYHLLSHERNEDIRLKVGLTDKKMSISSVTDIWQSAAWYEREVWDMFGLGFEGLPDLRRILMPPTWQGHPLRKEHPARATELGPFVMPEDEGEAEENALRLDPEALGMRQNSAASEFMYLNVGPHHPGTHGLLRIMLQLDGEEIIDAVPDIGFHHRGAEKMGERQTWHSYIPYTDRVDYLGGVMNNLAYVLGVEKLAGIKVPERAQVIRVMLSELFRIASHLVFYGTFAQDVGAMSPVFFTFNDRERIFDIISAITGGRMHPSWFRIGGTAHDLPEGWDGLIRDFVGYFPNRLKELDSMILKNSILRSRTKGVGSYTLDEAIEWGVTGPGLRACGLEWDFRKKRPYSGYDQFEFDIPTAVNGDCYDRCVVRVEEMRQSLRIVEQCLNNMPSGPYKAQHPLTTPPLKDRTMHDIETLIAHFLNVSWGPVIPAGEAFSGIEATKGGNGYYLVSDGGTMPYRVRIRTPSFPHLQMIPMLSRGSFIPDLLATLGSIDFVLADVDR